MLAVKKSFPNPLKDYIEQLKDQSKEGSFFTMLKKNKSMLEESMRKENPIERYIKGFSEKRLFETEKKGNFLNLSA